MLATNAINKRRLPADVKDRSQFVGVRLLRTGSKRQYFQARFSIPKTLLSDIGKPGRVAIRGTPQNGYVISAGDDLKLMILDNVSVAYLNVSAERINMPRDERAVIWMRGQIEKNILRIPPLPTAWIGGQGEFGGSEKISHEPVARLSTRPRRSSPASSKRHGSSFASLRSGLACGSPSHATSRSLSISVADDSAPTHVPPVGNPKYLLDILGPVRC